MLSMDKTDFRSLIKHYFLTGKTAKETKEKLDQYYGANAPSHYNAKYWFREFRGARNSTTNQVRNDRIGQDSAYEKVILPLGGSHAHSEQRRNRWNKCVELKWILLFTLSSMF